MSLIEKHLYRFGLYRLDPVERVLWHQGQPLPLPPKDLEMLIVLVERAGHIVEKDELLERVWPGVFIEEGNLSRRIFNLRQALGDRPDGQKYIETVPRRGYRFTARVEESGESPPAVQPAISDSGLEAKPPRSNETRKFWLWPLAVTVLLVITAGLASQHFLRARNISSQKVMLAVLPFANLSGDAGDEYFADGFTEEMITQLGEVQPTRLGVIARTSAMHYKNSQESAGQIGRELGVNYLLEGSVRQDADHVRITAQLIQASDQTDLWAESYDAPLTDVLRVQQEIAGRITNSLRLELLPQARSGQDAYSDPEVYHEYLLGLNESRKATREGEEKAIQYFKQAIAKEPGNARLYAGLAQAYDASVPYYLPPAVAMPLVKQAAERALQLDPNLVSAHAALGDAHLLYDWDWKAAESEYRRALDMNPSSPEAQLGYANYFSTLGKHDEALAHVQQIYRVDPLAVDSRIETLWVYFFSGRMEETVAQAQKTLDLEPQAAYASAILALAYAQMGRRLEAVHAAETAARLTDSPGVIVVAVSALARVGEREKATRLLDRALELAQTRYICRFLLAAAYADLGEKENALASLERGIREKST